MMNSLELITQQRRKEAKLLKLFLLSSLLASLVFHAGAMTVRVGNFWRSEPTVEEEAEIEVTVTEAPPEEPIKEDGVIPEPEIPQEVAFAPELAPPPIPLAPASQAPLTPGEDAPSKEPPAPTNDPVTPLTNSAGDTAATGGNASGPITSPDGNGSGFGNAPRPTGFAPNGTPAGSVDGKPGGTPTGKPGGEPGQVGVRTVTPTPPPPRSQEPTCISCPKPQFQGTEASPRVDMRIRPDGSVEVRLRKSSGDPAIDRATLETMSRWRFDPKTVPQEGVRKRVRVTFEEEGSSFQRQNEARRRQEADRKRETERRRLAEEERRQAEERQRAPATATTESPVSPSPTTPAPQPAPSTAPETPAAPPPVMEAPPPEPAPAPVAEPAPAPAPAPEPAPAPAPVEVPPPTP